MYFVTQAILVYLLPLECDIVFLIAYCTLKVLVGYLFTAVVVVCYEPYVVSQLTGASSASYRRSSPPSKLVNGHELTICDTVWVSQESQLVISKTPFLAARIAVALTRSNTI